ncbi:hypothetical protein B0H11DRAFT_2216032 [Mycena galericulata]|nr:hypothetical protein B0H11DRAFT_2216032 [Mycena galericulata]
MGSPRTSVCRHSRGRLYSARVGNGSPVGWRQTSASVDGSSARWTEVHDYGRFCRPHTLGHLPTTQKKSADQAARVPPARIRAWTSHVQLRLRLHAAPPRELRGDGGLAREGQGEEGEPAEHVYLEGLVREMAMQTVFLFLIAIDDFREDASFGGSGRVFAVRAAQKLPKVLEVEDQEEESKDHMRMRERRLQLGLVPRPTSIISLGTKQLFQ